MKLGDSVLHADSMPTVTDFYQCIKVTEFCLLGGCESFVSTREIVNYHAATQPQSRS